MPEPSGWFAFQLTRGAFSHASDYSGGWCIEQKLTTDDVPLMVVGSSIACLSRGSI